MSQNSIISPFLSEKQKRPWPMPSPGARSWATRRGIPSSFNYATMPARHCSHVYSFLLIRNHKSLRFGWHYDCDPFIGKVPVKNINHDHALFVSLSFTKINGFMCYTLSYTLLKQKICCKQLPSFLTFLHWNYLMRVYKFMYILFNICI